MTRATSFGGRRRRRAGPPARLGLPELGGGSQFPNWQPAAIFSRACDGLWGVIRWLAEQGATDIKRLPQRGRARHPRLGFCWHHEDWVVVISGSPGKTWNADRDAITELRHLLGLVLTEKRVGERRVAKRRPKLATAAFNDPDAQFQRQFAPRGAIAKLADFWPEARA